MFYQMNTLSEKLGFFLYLFIGCYKCNDVVMHEKLQINFQELKRIYLINIKKILFMLFASAAAPKRTSVQADRWLIASSVTLNDALKRDSSPLGHAVC